MPSGYFPNDRVFVVQIGRIFQIDLRTNGVSASDEAWDGPTQMVAQRYNP